MKNMKNWSFLSLHVRVSNRAAVSLYGDRLGCCGGDGLVGFSEDVEGGFEMCKDLNFRNLITS